MIPFFNFDTTYNQLPQIFYQYTKPAPARKPELLLYNGSYAKTLGVMNGAHGREIADILSGNNVPENGSMLSQAYAGHQFGYFTMLGDGRAILLGEHITDDGERLDIQLKGSGRTMYSRNGDGRAAVGPMVREYIISEAMHYLGIPTTRSLAVVGTGEKVYRGSVLDGAVLTRTADSHIRVGTFEFAAMQGNKGLIKILADYTINRHYPELKDEKNPYLEFFKKTAKRQACLINDWMRVGFIHGVMNTDNMSISGQTIDYGPCAFMDSYNLKTVFSSIDHRGRYSYGNQPYIAGWNLACLAETLIPLIDDDPEKAAELLTEGVKDFSADYHGKWLQMMGSKLGFSETLPDDLNHIQALLDMMESGGYDYTNTFIYLRHLLKPLNIDSKQLFPGKKAVPSSLNAWAKKWRKTLEQKKQTAEKAVSIMDAVNPLLIPRNHLVEAAVKKAEDGDMSSAEKLLEVLTAPYDYSFEDMYYILPTEDRTPYVTYCGT